MSGPMRAVGRLLWLGCFVAAYIALSTNARASPSPSADHAGVPRVALLPVRLEGKLESHWLTMLEARLVEGMQRGRFELVEAKRVLDAEPEAAECETSVCFVRIARAVEADALLRWRIEGGRRHYTLELELVRGEDGSVAARSTETCEVCGVAEVGDVLAHQAAALRSKLDAGLLAPPVLRFTSNPPGATIVIDGRTAGSTPHEEEVQPGARQLVARHSGYVPEERTVMAVAGVEESVHFVLTPVGDERRGRRRDPAPWGWATLGLGLAATGVGVPLLVLDSRPYRARCSGTDVDHSGRCKYLYDTFAGGVALTVSGAVLTVVGAAILLGTRRKKTRRAGLSLRPDGFGFALRL